MNKKKKVRKTLPKNPKPIKNPEHNINHPDYADKFEFAFECKGKKYFRCIKDFYYPVGRYKFIQEKLAEADLRITVKLLKDYVAELQKLLNPVPGGIINLTKIGQLVINLGTHVDLEFSPMTIKKLASVVYIDETEDVRDFDEEYGDNKIKFWEENGVYDFFLTKPIGELLNVSNTSEESLMKFIKTISETEKDLISELYSQSWANT